MTQPGNMLELQQLVLKSIAGNPQFFRKELIKSIKWLDPDEVKKLHKWLIDNYMAIHKNIILEVFKFYIPESTITCTYKASV